MPQLHPLGTEAGFIQLARGAAELAEKCASNRCTSSPGAAASRELLLARLCCSPHYLALAAVLP